MIKWLSILLISTVVSTQTGYEAFLQSPAADEELHVRGVDENLLNQTIFHLINEKRAEKGLDTLQYEEALTTVSRRYQSKFEFRRFKYPEKVERKIERKLAEKTRKEGFKGGLVLPIVGQWDGINFERGSDFFFDKKETETEFHLFYGTKPKKKDKDKDRDVIPNHTYRSFAEALLENLDSPNKKKLYGQSYKWGGLHCQWYYKSINKKKIPQIKMIFILGGFQTAGMRFDD